MRKSVESVEGRLKGKVKRGYALRVLINMAHQQLQQVLLA